MAADHDTDTEVVAGAVLLGWNQILRFLGWFRGNRELVFPDEDEGNGRFSNVAKG